LTKKFTFNEIADAALKEADTKLSEMFKPENMSYVRFALGFFIGCVHRRMAGEADPDLPADSGSVKENE
jgi:hypothetical protein